MKSKQQILDAIITQGLLPLFYYHDEQVSVAIVRVLYKAGIRVLEYTNRGEKALENYKALKKLQQEEMPDLHLGIGTVKSLKEAEEYLAAGADFFVSPVINPQVGKLAAENDMLWIPGCMTATEIFTAQQCGATLVKIFPANILGPEFLTSIKDLFTGLLFMPTGGVELDQDNIKNWFTAGVSAVGFGSKLISKAVLENKDYDKLHKDTLTAIEFVKNGR